MFFLEKYFLQTPLENWPPSLYNDNIMKTKNMLHFIGTISWYRQRDTILFFGNCQVVNFNDVTIIRI